jgi:hypothetical protein
MLPPPVTGNLFGYAVAILLALVSLGGLRLPDVYARETPSWAIQAIAQDWFDITIAAPVIASTTALAVLGSRRARFVLCGALLFAAYTMAIYCFSIHLNALFLLYCVAFGAAVFGVLTVGASLVRDGANEWFEERIPRRFAGGVLVGIGVVFAALWLAQLIPAAQTGVAPGELIESGLPTNPVHVIDLSIVLPLHVLAGVALWQRRPLGRLLAPVLLSFGVLMAASIAMLALLLEVRGRSSGMPVAAAMTGVAAVELAALVGILRGIRARAMHHSVA